MREVGRRNFIGTAATLLAAPPAARAQPAGKVFRIGYLSAPTRASVESILEVFRRALRDLGWIENQNVVIDYRWAEGDLDRLPGLAEDLVRQKVDVIVAPATSAALAAKRATATIPIVMMFPTDPVAMGLVSNLRRPGGNVTGTANISLLDLLGKRLQILKEAVPAAGRVAIAYEAKAPDITPPVNGLDATARSMGLQLHYVETGGPEDFEEAFARMSRQRIDALLVAGGATFLVHRSRFNEIALQRRLPTMYSVREGVEGGGLLSYGLNMRDFVGRAATYVDKIFRGARPGELPVEQPTKFELIVNLRTAKALGLALPRALLQRADEVIG